MPGKLGTVGGGRQATGELARAPTSQHSCLYPLRSRGRFTRSGLGPTLLVSTPLDRRFSEVLSRVTSQSHSAMSTVSATQRLRNQASQRPSITSSARPATHESLVRYARDVSYCRSSCASNAYDEKAAEIRLNGSAGIALGLTWSKAWWLHRSTVALGPGRAHPYTPLRGKLPTLR